MITALMDLKLQANLSKDQSSCLGVFGLRLNTTEKDLRKVFSKCGPPSDVCMAYDLTVEAIPGFAFVYFEKRGDAAEVMADEF